MKRKSRKFGKYHYKLKHSIITCRKAIKCIEVRQTKAISQMISDVYCIVTHKYAHKLSVNDNSSCYMILPRL